MEYYKGDKMAYIRIDENYRVTAASLNFYCGEEIEVQLPKELSKLSDIHDYKYINGQFVYDPIIPEEIEKKPSQLDIIEAQVTYTAMMTDTLLQS